MKIFFFLMNVGIRYVHEGVDVAPVTSTVTKKVKSMADFVRPVVEATSAEEQGNYTTDHCLILV